MTLIGVSTEKCQEQMCSQTYHICLQKFQRQRLEEQIRQIGKHVKERVEREERNISQSMDAEERFHQKKLGYTNGAFKRDMALPSHRSR